MIDRGGRPRTVLFASYNGLLDPLGASQILPYLERLRTDWPIRILSFERAERLADNGALARLRARLSERDIGWSMLRYHKRPSLLATSYDVVRGMVEVRRIMLRERIALVHSRSYVTNSVVLNAAPGVPFLFDIRGLQADEYVDGGVWKEGELKWQLAKRQERRFFRAASAAVVLTENIRPDVVRRFEEVGRAPPLEVIPCCVDLARFRFDEGERRRTRSRLGIPDDVTLFVYAGSLGTWYLADEMAAFARAYGERRGERVALMWLVNNDAELARQASARAGLDPAQVHVLSARAEEVPGYLAAADVGLALIKGSFSKRSSSPTKYAEYLAMGLPIVITPEVGDGAAILARDGGVGIGGDRGVAIDRLAALRRKPRAHFRAVAEALFDIDTVGAAAYRRLYRGLLDR